MTFFKTLATAAAFTLLSVSAQAEHIKVGDLTVSKAWTRATPPNAKAGAGFVTVTNNGSEADRLVGVSSAVAERTEIHEMAVVDGVMKMRELETGVEIPAGETVTLKPGGLHIMFMGLKGKFIENEDVPVTLTFEKAGTVDVHLAVAPMGSKEMSHDHGGDHKHDDHSGHGKN
ncbi:copper chaperone PCu(A)C [Roseibium sediminis]|uniref:copper chaperone PCu(A)C n=1 Tax=Roseibium sediminis TaxID=1775174 RepID=UPI00123D4F7B|nr:copper chaperone PCu(A)C [Roseibium sediminis]